MESVPLKDQESFTHAFSNTSLLNQISTQIKVLDLQAKSTSCLDKTYVLASSETSTSDEEEEENPAASEEESLNVISKLFEEDSPLAINKIRQGNSSTTRNFYPKPTPPDLQYEEIGTFVTNSFDGQSIYTWNIDGKSEHEILNTLQEMTMAMTAYKTRGLESRNQAIAIINSFQGKKLVG